MDRRQEGHGAKRRHHMTKDVQCGKLLALVSFMPVEEGQDLVERIESRLLGGLIEVSNEVSLIWKGLR